MNRSLKKIVSHFGALVVLFFCSFSYSNAQDTTNNLLNNTWSGAINNYTGGAGGYSGGSTPAYNSSTNTIYFGYTQSTISQAIAINNALQGSGVQVGGVNYGFSYYNQGDNSGTLSSLLSITSNTGALLHSYSNNHGPTTNGWTPFNNAVTFGPYGLTNLGNATLSLSGRDSRFWAGYYGPMVKDPYVNLTYTAATITNPTFTDDSYVHVPLQFGFPFFGRTFTNSWMHSNGVVSFLDPAAPIPGATYNPGQWAYCCEGLNLVPQNTQLGPQFNYMIAPLWTDLYPVASSTFGTEGTTTYQRYFWNNIAEISNQNNLNTFSLEIRPSGFIGATYNQINIQNQNVTAGITGDIALGQMQQFYYGRGILPGALSNWSVNNTPVDQCVTNPLSSPTCAGYTEAMCASNPLYSVTCPGYQQAYFNQQCTANPLYDVNCPGYASAYLTYQCSLDPLYSTTCAGYEQAYLNQQCSISPLYSTQCSGYTTASAQCSINPLYASYCPNFSTATTQCTANSLYASYCPGYQTALNTCSTNPLSNTLCSGYTTASQVCSNNQLTYTYCPSYTTALASCSTNPQSNNLCPGYNSSPTNSTSLSPTLITSTKEPTVAVGTDGKVEATVSKTGDSNVDKAISPPTTSTNPSTSPAAPVVLTQQNPQMERRVESMERKDGPSSQTSQQQAQKPSQGNDSAGSGGGQKTARQEIAERRTEAAKQQAVEKGKEAQKEMQNAQSFEQQKAVQNVVLAAMGFNPGFDAYSKAIILDARGYQPFTVYNNQKNVDNARLSRGLFGATDRLHNEMVDSQYKLGK